MVKYVVEHQLTTIGHSLEVFLGLRITFIGPDFHFCLELALEKSEPKLLEPFFETCQPPRIEWYHWWLKGLTFAVPEILPFVPNLGLYWHDFHIHSKVKVSEKTVFIRCKIVATSGAQHQENYGLYNFLLMYF